MNRINDNLPSITKKKLLSLLSDMERNDLFTELKKYNLSKTINKLFPFLYNPDPHIKWKAVESMGALVSDLAERNIEAAREILRRLSWSLMEESGGVGWGAPEAFGEILVRNGKLAKEFAPQLVSFIRQDGNYLEFEQLMKGVLWAIGRLAENERSLLQDLNAGQYLIPFLSSDDSELRGLAAFALCTVGEKNHSQYLDNLENDRSSFSLYFNGTLKTVTIANCISAYSQLH